MMATIGRRGLLGSSNALASARFLAFFFLLAALFFLRDGDKEEDERLERALVEKEWRDRCSCSVLDRSIGCCGWGNDKDTEDGDDDDMSNDDKDLGLSILPTRLVVVVVVVPLRMVMWFLQVVLIVVGLLVVAATEQ